MRVKICGITNYEDAKFACDMGADAIGFVTYNKSPRFIEIEKIKEIIKKLPPFITKTVLFVNVSSDYINEVISYTKANLAQIHFDVDEVFLQKLNCNYIRVVRAKEESDIDKFSGYKIVDAYVKSYGGSGKRVALEWFKNRDNSKTILAGGLNPDNLDEVRGYGFYGVDVSSGVEKELGKKDKEKVKRFIQKAKGI